MVKCEEVRAVHGNCLHDAIKEKDLEKLKHLLLRSNMPLNCEDCNKDTPLHFGVYHNYSDAIVMCLLKAGCKADTWPGLLTTALYRKRVDVAQELLKGGYDVNRNIFGITALHRLALYASNLERICLLLYYEIDINRSVSPFVMAMDSRVESVALTLFPFHSDFSRCTSPHRHFPLYYSLKQQKSTLFELIWPKFDHQILLNNETPFLQTYLTTCEFTSTEWIKCLDLLLSSTVAEELIRECVHLESPLFSKLLKHAKEGEIDKKYRVDMINFCLSLGAAVTIEDFNVALALFGFGEEVEAFIYAGSFFTNSSALQELFPLSMFILLQEGSSYWKFIFQMFKNQILTLTNPMPALHILRYISLPPNVKLDILLMTGTCFPDFLGTSEKWREIVDTSAPPLPSLLELARNKTRNLIKAKCNQPYQFYDAVKSLDCSNYVKDILLFKTPIYGYVPRSKARAE